MTDQQMKRLYSLVGLEETLRPANRQAGWEPQLEEVLSRLKMMGAFKL